MNDIISLSYNGSNIRTAEKDGQLWWVLADVCKVLELLMHQLSQAVLMKMK